MSPRRTLAGVNMQKRAWDSPWVTPGSLTQATHLYEWETSIARATSTHLSFIVPLARARRAERRARGLGGAQR